MGAAASSVATQPRLKDASSASAADARDVDKEQTSPDVPLDPDAMGTIQDLASRAVTVSGILFFLCELFRGTVMQFDPETTTTAEVAHQAIIPLSAAQGCAYAKIMNGGRSRSPDMMVSHAWGNKFVHLVAAVVAHAAGHKLYYDLLPRLKSLKTTLALLAELGPDVLNKTAWLCIFGVNQHVSICRCHTRKHLNGSPLCEMDKFDQMIAHMRSHLGGKFRQVIALGVKGVALTRAWVVAEIATCLDLAVQQSVMIWFPVALGDTGLREAVEGLDVRKCEASRVEDKERILEGIKDKDEYNSSVRSLLVNAIEAPNKYDKVIFIAPQALFASCLLLAILILARSSRSELPDRLVFAGWFAVGGAMLLNPCLRFFYYYKFMCQAMVNADRLGLCRELLAQVPKGPAWSTPVIWLYRKMAWLAGDRPHGMWRLAAGMAFTGIGLFSSSGAIMLDCSHARWGMKLAVLLGCMALLFIFVAAPIYLPQRYSQWLTVLLLVVVIVDISIFGLVLLLETWQQQAIRWCWSELERTAFIIVLAAFACLLAHPVCSVLPWLRVRAAKSGGGGHKMKQVVPAEVDEDGIWLSEEVMAVREQVRQNVDAWSKASLWVTGLPEESTDRSLKSLFDQFGPVVGVFPVNTVATCAFTGSATVTYRSAEDAVAALAAMSQPDSSRPPLQARLAASIGQPPRVACA